MANFSVFMLARLAVRNVIFVLLIVFALQYFSHVALSCIRCVTVLPVETLLP